jgi:hypothetical protein
MVREVCRPAFSQGDRQTPYYRVEEDLLRSTGEDWSVMMGRDAVRRQSPEASGRFGKTFVYDMPKPRKSLILSVEVVFKESRLIQCRWI